MRAELRSRITASIACLFMLVTLSGCLYPGTNSSSSQKQVPSSAYLEQTQKAIDQYREDTGVLPLVNRDAKTPIFEKYEIDFTKLIPNYLPDFPGNAFEAGGIYKYVLIDVETTPTVRLLHLGMVNQVGTIQQAVIRYRNYYNKLPIAEDIGNGYYTLDFGKLSMKEQWVDSAITTNQLRFIMNEKGEVGIDYAPDIEEVIKNSQAEVPRDSDPRYVMAREALFVPVKSFPYSFEDGRAVLLKL